MRNNETWFVCLNKESNKTIIKMLPVIFNFHWHGVSQFSTLFVNRSSDRWTAIEMFTKKLYGAFF